MEKMEFKAESKRLLDLMINSIYTHKEIFLREIISNASDAIDKLCFISLTDDKVGLAREDFRIKVSTDEDARLLKVSDNGIGMTRDELEQNLGVIAYSGSADFRQIITESGQTEDGDSAEGLDIIGQFGVGFYSAFMVADVVTVITRAYGSDTAYKWESAGADGFTIEEWEKASIGTDVIMRIKEDFDEENDFLSDYRLRGIIKKYSNYISWPIVMDTEQFGEDDEEPIVIEETVNSMVPIWQRSKNDAPDEDCIAFYREKYFDTSDPVRVIRVSVEGSVSYKSLLFVPENTPYDFFNRDFKSGLQLYSNGVLIMEHCPDILPEHFRFVRGVVDSPDLSLNISREMLQHDRQLRVISSNVEKKVKSELKKLMDDDPDRYTKFYESFGLTLKYGIVSDYGLKKDMLSDLVMFHSSTDDKLISLSDYVSAMPEDQEYIYYATADSLDRALALPQAETVKRRGFDMLCMVQDVDEFVVQILGNYEEKDFRSVNSGELGLESEEEKEAVEKKEEELSELLVFVKRTLGDRVADVRLSHKLVSHAVCLSADGDISIEMEKYFTSLPDGRGTDVKAQRVLELNGEHPAIGALNAAFAVDKERAAKLAEILYGQASLMAGLDLNDAAGYTELILGLF